MIARCLVLAALACFGPSAAAEEPSAMDLDALLADDTTKPASAPAAADLDALLADTPESKPANAWQDLWKSTGWKWKTAQYNFSGANSRQSATDDTQKNLLYTQLEFDTTHKASWGEVRIEGMLQEGTEKNTYAPGREAQINQFYLKYKLAAADLLIGTRYIEDGINTLYSPLNRLSRADAAHPFAPDELGVWQISYTSYSDASSTEFRILPYFQPSKVPPKTSRWLAGNGNYNFPGIDLQGRSVAEAPVSHTIRDTGFLLRHKATHENTDYIGMAYWGNLPNSILKRRGALNYQQSYIRGGFAGGGFSTVQGKWEFHGEALIQAPEARQDDTFLSTAFGFEYDLNLLIDSSRVESARLILDYAHEWLLTPQNNPDTPLSMAPSRPGRNTLLLLQKVDVSDKSKYYYAFTVNISSHDNASRLGWEYKLGDGNSIETSYEWFNGRDNTLFGRWNANDLLIFRFTKEL